MRIAIDIDGTLSHWHKIFWQIMWAFPEHTLLTGSTDVNRPYEDHLESRRRQVKCLGIDWDVNIVICIGRDAHEVAVKKAEYCRDHGIMMFFDDTPDYCAAVRAISPGTMALLVCK